jgi:TDG/mug DNA glycosylase family protein
VTVDWMGEQIETLADLFPPEPRAVCVGINPAPRSVEAGHYYQGRQGQRFFGRLRQAEVLGAVSDGFEDDAALAAGIGFTDVLKRPTPSADLLTSAEKRHGVELLAEKLAAVRAPVIIFPFKAAAVELVGRFEDNGWLRQEFAGSRLFVMPPYDSATTAAPTLASLRSGISRLGVPVPRSDLLTPPSANAETGWTGPPSSPGSG